MKRGYFMTAGELGFSRWSREDEPLARLLWGDPAVTRWICASGQFAEEEITARLEKEIANDALYHIQYWPVFDLSSGELVGCCGLRPRKEGEYELGFHLRPAFWGKGIATRAATAVINYAFGRLGAQSLFAGHNPNNTASRCVLNKLGFEFIGEEFYEPTGLCHPSYQLKRRET